ncbi:hypothetical protein ACIRRA_35110 [Nocardia sp. NPDC101769]
MVRTRERGYAYNDEELDPGFRTLAAPSRRPARPAGSR